MNTLLAKIANPLIRSHIRAWLISAVTYLTLYIAACVANQTPSIHNLVIGTLNALQSFIPALSGIVENGQIIPAKLAGVIWLLLSAAILPALLRIPWIQKNQLADEIVTDAEQVAQTAPDLTARPATIDAQITQPPAVNNHLTT